MLLDANENYSILNASLPRAHDAGEAVDVLIGRGQQTLPTGAS
jgi:hypothetical protein